MNRNPLLLCVTILLMFSMVACAAGAGPAGSPPPRDSAPPQPAEASVFTDVPSDAPCREAVEWCRENGLMNGVSHTAFDPDGALTRAMLAAVLYRAEGAPAVTGAVRFTDVQTGRWYADAVLWASGAGLLQGYGSGLFGPNDPVSAEMLDVVMARYRGEEPSWSGDPAEAVPATRAQVAMALYETLGAPHDREEPVGDGKVLVAYFSATGTTRGAAELVQAATGGDLFEIVPAQPYTAADLNYRDPSSRSQVEQRSEDARPAITGTAEDLDGYDVVFLGYPIWNGRPPKIISTFLERCDFTGKTIVPFCTSGGSGFSDSGLHELASGAQWREGRRLNGASRDDVAQWIAGLDLNRTEDAAMTITVTNGDATVVFELNASPAARSLAAQLPLTLEVQPFGSNEQTFYPPEKLDTADTPAITSAQAGTLAYYAPWGDVVMFYDGLSGGGGGLYELGNAVEGADAIRGLTGTITVTAR